MTASYLVSLLCAATEFLQQEQVYRSIGTRRVDKIIPTRISQDWTQHEQMSQKMFFRVALHPSPISTSLGSYPPETLRQIGAQVEVVTNRHGDLEIHKRASSGTWPRLLLTYSRKTVRGMRAPSSCYWRCAVVEE
jgi:hypothetical protein